MFSIRRSAGRSVLAAMFLSAAALGGSSCGLLGDTDDLLNFTIPVTYTIPATLPIQYPPLDQIEQMQNNNERSLAIISYIPVDASSLDSRLTSGELVEEVRITGMTMSVLTNTLEDVNIEPFEIRVGAPGTQFMGSEDGGTDWGDAIPVAVTPVVLAATPGFVGDVPAVIAPDQLGASDRIAQLQFGIGFGTTLSIPEGEFTSGGKAEVQFTIELGFVVSPL